MCRLLGLIGKTPINTIYLRDFRKLAEDGIVKNGSERGHKSGWGLVYYENGQAKYLSRRPFNASEDPVYGEVCRTLEKRHPSGIFVAHLRKASKGKRAEKNTHPFIHGKFTFAHNGTIKANGDLFRGLQVEGDTDSERMFALIEREISHGLKIVDAFESVAEKIRKNSSYTSLTSIFSDGEKLYAYRDFSRDGQYYNLFSARINGQVVVSQEPLWNLDWANIPNRTLAEIDIHARVKMQRFT